MGVKRCYRVSGIMVLIEKPTPEKLHLLATVLKGHGEQVSALAARPPGH